MKSRAPNYIKLIPIYTLSILGFWNLGGLLIWWRNELNWIFNPIPSPNYTSRGKLSWKIQLSFQACSIRVKCGVQAFLGALHGIWPCQGARASQPWCANLCAKVWGRMGEAMLSWNFQLSFPCSAFAFGLKVPGSNPGGSKWRTPLELISLDEWALLLMFPRIPKFETWRKQ